MIKRMKRSIVLSLFLVIGSCKTVQNTEFELSSVQVRIPNSIDYDLFTLTFISGTEKIVQNSSISQVKIPYGTYTIEMKIMKGEEILYSNCKDGETFVIDDPIENPKIRLCKPNSDVVVSTINEIPEESNVSIDLEIDDRVKERHGDLKFASGSICTQLGMISKNDDEVYRFSVDQSLFVLAIDSQKRRDLCVVFLPLPINEGEIPGDFRLTGSIGAINVPSDSIEIGFEVVENGKTIRESQSSFNEQISQYSLTTKFSNHAFSTSPIKDLCIRKGDDLEVRVYLRNKSSEKIILKNLNFPNFVIEPINGGKLICSNDTLKPNFKELCQGLNNSAKVEECRECMDKFSFDDSKIQSCLL